MRITSEQEILGAYVIQKNDLKIRLAIQHPLVGWFHHQKIVFFIRDLTLTWVFQMWLLNFGIALLLDQKTGEEWI